MTHEERVLAFFIKFNELGYLPLNEETTAGFVKVIEEVIEDELAFTKEKVLGPGVHHPHRRRRTN